MKYRTLGKTGEKVSILGFGAMRLPHFVKLMIKSMRKNPMKF